MTRRLIIDDDRSPCYLSDAGFVRPGLSPLARREEIRLALELGDWQTAAEHLHRVHQTGEYRMVTGIATWTAYVETIPISRTYAWHLCLIAATDSTRVANTFRKARAAALIHAADRRHPPTVIGERAAE